MCLPPRTGVPPVFAARTVLHTCTCGTGAGSAGKTALAAVRAASPPAPERAERSVGDLGGEDAPSGYPESPQDRQAPPGAEFVSGVKDLLKTFGSAPAIEGNLFGMLQGIQPAQFENVINLLANELASSSDPFVLVLDDLHMLHSETVLKMLSYLLEHMPSRMHLAILTRADPPLPFARLRAHGQPLDFRADHLRLTQPEIAAFLNEAMGLRLSASDLSAKEKRKEG